MNSVNSLCPSCFKVKDSQTVCPHCGFDESARLSPIILPYRTLLNDQYLSGKVLGKPGGFGITYLGWDTRLETCVAIKEFLPRDMAGRDYDRRTVIPHSQEDEGQFKFGLDQFLNEAKTLAKIDHANVVRIRNFFEENGTAYLVMDYYDGVTLEEFLNRQGGKIPEKLAVDIMMPILDGLREVHEKGFLHRDIKPQNIYLTQSKRPILLDFGAARFAFGERTRSLSVMLTPGYSPYEQYQRNGKQGPWTDIYACGATLYKMVTGEAPPEAIEREKEDTLISPNRKNNISTSLNDAIMNSLEKDPEKRPENVKTFQEILLSHSPASSHDENPSIETTSQYYGVHGWLKFFCIGLTIISPLFTLVAISMTNAARGIHENLDSYISLNVLISLFLMIMSIRAGIILWKRKPNAVKIAKNYLTLYIISNISLIVMAYMLLPSEISSAMGGDLGKEFAQSLFFFIVWYSYLSKSKRVKATYQ